MRINAAAGEGNSLKEKPSMPTKILGLEWGPSQAQMPLRFNFKLRLSPRN